MECPFSENHVLNYQELVSKQSLQSEHLFQVAATSRLVDNHFWLSVCTELLLLLSVMARFVYKSCNVDNLTRD